MCLPKRGGVVGKEVVGVAVEPVCNIVTLRKEPISVTLEGLVHRTCNRGVGIVGCKQLQSEDSHALPSIN